MLSVGYPSSRSGSLVDIKFDERVPTYTGLLLTEVVYKLASVVVETLSFTYDTCDRVSVISGAESGETLTFSYNGSSFLSGVVKT